LAARSIVGSHKREELGRRTGLDRDLSVQRSRHSRNRLRTPLLASQEDQHLERAGGSKRSTRASGSQASCTTISDTSTWSKKRCNLSTTVRHEVVTHVLGTTSATYVSGLDNKSSWRRE